jgi:O-succinylbenzoic acid--CoA ligase
VEARSDEIINVGGTKVRPEEVEQVLLQDENIAEAAAYGVQTARGQTLLVAALVCRGPVDVPQTLQRCHAVLGQRAPARLVKIERLPRNEAGKVLRRELAARTTVRQAQPEAERAG